MKKKAPKGWIKISEFKKLTGINDKTIFAAIRRGTISDELVDRVGALINSPYYLNPQQVAVEWYNNIDESYQQTRNTVAALEAYINTFNSKVVEDKRISLQTGYTPDGQMTKAEAKRRQAVARAKMAQLNLAIKQGILVERAPLDEKLFSLGRELRDALLAVPDRIAAQVVAAALEDDREKVLNIINSALEFELKRLDNIEL